MSGNTEKAVIYLQRAGAQALQRSAYVEAHSHLITGLEVLATVPETPTRHQQELDLLIALDDPQRHASTHTDPGRMRHTGVNCRV